MAWKSNYHPRAFALHTYPSSPSLELAMLRILLTESIPTEDTLLNWWWLDAGRITAQGQDVLAAMPIAPMCEAIAPAAVVLLTQVKLPVQKGEKARRLLPFALEDQLANDADANHFALGAPLAEGMVAVAVVDKNWLRAVVTLLATRHLQHIYPETLLLPLPDNGWSFAWAGQQGMVRTGEYTGQVLEGGDGVPMALSALRRNTPDAQLYCYGTPPTWAAQLDAHHGGNWQAATAAPLDLLQGEFTQRPLRWAGWTKLLPLLWLLGAMLALQLIGTGVEVWRLKREQRQLQSQMEAHFRAAFPEATVIVDPVLQMERQRTTLRRAAGVLERNDFLSLLSKITPLLTAHKPQKIVYENQTLQLEIALAHATDITALRTRLLNLPLKHELTPQGTVVHLKVWE